MTKKLDKPWKGDDWTGRGWPPIFTNKMGGRRYQGAITLEAALLFEDARTKLAAMAGRPHMKTVSDADTIEALARGWEKTAEYIAEQKRKGLL